MINRPQGFRHEDWRMTEINLYPTTTIYVDGEDDYDNPKCESFFEWADKLCDWAKEQYPLCKFSVAELIHDADFRIYAEIRIQSPNGSHSGAADWLEAKGGT